MTSDRGKVEAPQPTSERPMIEQTIAVMYLYDLLGAHAESVNETHRLAWVHIDEDSEPVGQMLFVCKCQEGLERRKFNAHIRDAYAGLL